MIINYQKSLTKPSKSKANMIFVFFNNKCVDKNYY